jgi:hypothetical protein
VRRREFITLLGVAAAWPLAARAQGPNGKIARIGIIDDSPNWDPFRQQLRELHYVEGQNIAYVYLRTNGDPDQLDAAASAHPHPLMLRRKRCCTSINRSASTARLDAPLFLIAAMASSKPATSLIPMIEFNAPSD